MFMDAGLDSISYFEVLSSLNAAFDVHLSSTAMFDFPTAESLARYIHANQPRPYISTKHGSHGMQQAEENADGVVAIATQDNNLLAKSGLSAVNANPWVSFSPVTVKFRLFCFPWSGGVSQLIYSSWATRLPASVQVCPLELPGRGRRAGEKPAEGIKQLANALAQNLPLQDRPYALCGISMGGILVYETARAIERVTTKQQPKLLIIAASTPPQHYENGSDLARLLTSDSGKAMTCYIPFLSSQRAAATFFLHYIPCLWRVLTLAHALL